ncbi:MAG: hypothetical protein OEM52_12020 [bacterium]|nr:hypothetical protein [bacterium]
MRNILVLLTSLFAFQLSESITFAQDSLLMHRIGGFDTPGYARSVARSGNNALIADGNSLQIVNISNYSAPQFVGACTTPGIAYDLIAYGNYVYLACGTAGVVAVNFSNPANPVISGICDTPGDARRLSWFAPNYTYLTVADGNSGVAMVQANDGLPVLLQSMSFTGFTHFVYASPFFWYVANGTEGIYYRQVSSGLTLTYPTPGEALFMSNWTIADGDSGVRFWSFNGTTASEVGCFDTPGYVSWVNDFSQFAFITDGINGLRLIDKSNPANPYEYAFYDTPGTAESALVGINENCVFVADGTAGMGIYGFEEAVRRLTLTTPVGGESWGIGTIVPIRWTSNNIVGNVQVDITRNYGHGRTWETLFSNEPNDGEILWTVTGAPTTYARIQIRAEQHLVTSMSPASFSLVPVPQSPSNLTISTSGDNANLSWSSVRNTITGDTITVNQYNLYRRPFDAMEWTPVITTNGDTTYTDPSILQTSPNMLYQVKAIGGQ